MNNVLPRYFQVLVALAVTNETLTLLWNFEYDFSLYTVQLNGMKPVCFYLQ